MLDADTRGYTDFVASVYGRLVRVAFLLVGDRGYAEDLAQAALVQTFLNWSRLAGPETAYVYTQTTLIRLGGRWGRRRWHGERPADLDAEEVAGTPGSDVDVATALDVRRALAALPFAQRAVLVLRYLEDLSEAQTAATLDCSVGTVKSRASRGLAALRAAGVLEVSTHNGGHDG